MFKAIFAVAWFTVKLTLYLLIVHKNSDNNALVLACTYIHTYTCIYKYFMLDYLWLQFNSILLKYKKDMKRNTKSRKHTNGCYWNWKNCEYDDQIQGTESGDRHVYLFIERKMPDALCLLVRALKWNKWTKSRIGILHTQHTKGKVKVLSVCMCVSKPNKWFYSLQEKFNL